jgi:LacI family transcriptional regulator
MSFSTDSRLSPHAVWRMLESASALETATLANTAALAASHERGAEGHVIGVAMNLDPGQMVLDRSKGPRHPFFDELLFGMRARASAGDLHILLLTALAGAATGLDVPYLEICRERHIDGIIVASYPPDEPGLLELVQSEIACVAIDTPVFGPRSTFVISDNVGGGRAVTHHLTELDRRRIAYIGGTGPEQASIDRRLGYESALADLGIEIRPEYVVHAGWDYAQARVQMRRLLELPEPPDAVFCASDRMAIGALCALEEAGLRVPEDVALAGFDDSELARLISPSLTTVRQDIIGLGTTAIEVMLQILEDPEATLPVSVLPVQLITRESSAGTEPLAEDERSGAHVANRASDDSGRKGRLSAPAAYRHLSETQPLSSDLLDTSRAYVRASSQSKNARRLVGLAMVRTPDQIFRHSFLDDICCAIRASAFARGIDLLNFSSHPNNSGQENISYPELCRRHGADGVIVVSLPYDDPATVALAESELPCVAIDIDLLGNRAGFVMSDNVGGGVQAVRHLAECGRERIAFLSGFGVERVVIDRHFGYQSELARLGLEQHEEYVRLAKWSHVVAYEETLRLLELPNPPNGIFAASDVMAIGALKAIADAGTRVPEDIAVVGFDDIEYARLLAPSLTTIRQNRSKLAEAAVDALSRMLERPGDAPPVALIPVDLVVRESTGGAPAAARDRNRFRPHEPLVDESV